MDGIMTWIQLRRLYDHGGDVNLRVNAIDDDVRKLYSPNFPGGLTGYIEQYQALMAELDTIAPDEYTDDRKQRLLIKNVRRIDCMTHLTTHCENMSYDMSADFLARSAILLDQERAQTPRRVMNVTGNVEEPKWLTIEESSLLLANAVSESNAYVAYQAFNNRPMRQSMRIPDDIWHAMEPDLKERVNALRAKVRAEREAKAPLAERSKQVPAGGIPAQYPTVRELNTIANVPATPKEHVPPAHTVVSLQNLNSVLFDDHGDDDTDDGLLDVRGYTVATCAVESEDLVTVRTHFEYAATTPPELTARHSGEDQSNKGGGECRDPQSRGEISQKRDHSQTREPRRLPPAEETVLDRSRRWLDSQPFVTEEPTVPPVFWFPFATGEIKFQRTSPLVTSSDEHAMPPATVHLEDPSVLDSMKMFAVTDAKDEDLSVLALGEKFESPVTEELQSRRKHVYNIFDATGDAAWTPSKFHDHKNLHITVNAIETQPFVPKEPTVPPVFWFPFATGEPTVPHVFDPKLIRTSFDNLCKASCPTRTSFDNLRSQRRTIR
jgi:hypothetical protein